MRASRLPSGAYSYVVRYTDADGQRHIKRFTDIDRETAKSAAEAFKGSNRRTRASSGSFKWLMDKYIASREAHLSPATIRGYRNIQKRLLTDYPFFCELSVSSIRKEDVQDVLNGLTQSGSKPKTIRNFNGLISGVLRENDAVVGKITLPQKTARDINVPSKKDVICLIKAAYGTDLEIPIMLAAFGGLRRGEVCGLRMSDIDGNVIHVARDVVQGSDKKWHTKPPKTKASDRYIEFSEKSIERIKEAGLPDLNPHELTLRFGRLSRRLFPDKQITYHSLRHFCASYLHSQGIPDQYILQRIGWENDACLKTIYRHVLADQEKQFVKKTNRSFDSFLK